MLGFRLNKLGAAMRSGLDLRSLYGGGASGFLPKLDNANYDKQTFNAPVTNAAAAGDPIGLWLPSQSPADVTNLLLWTDDQSNAVWVKSTSTVTSNVANAPAEVLGGAPIADLVADPGDIGTYQQLTLSSTGLTVCSSRYFKAGTATRIIMRDDNGAGRHIIFNLSTGAIISTAGSLLAYGVINAGGGWWRAYMAYTNDSTTLRQYGRNDTSATASTFYTCGGQVELGVTTPSTYQPNAGSLGGSNRRTGGANLLLWTTSYSQSFWTLNNVTNSEKTGTAASGQKIDVITGAAGSSLKLLRPTSNVTILAGGTYSVQFKVQYSTHRYVSLTFDDAATTNGCWTAFDLLNGTISRSAIAYGTGTAVTSTITSLGGTDYLITLTGTAGSSATGARIALSLQDSGTTQFNNSSSTGSLGVWDAGMNIGSLATYSRNIDQLGGLLLAAPLFQSTSANRGTLARRPASGIRNLSEYTSQFDNAYWTKTRSTITANATTAPDGTLTADKIVSDATAANTHDVRAQYTVTGSTFTRSIYAKAGEVTWLLLEIQNTSATSNRARAWFNLGSGVVGTGNTAGTGVTYVSHAIESAGNGWYRCSLTCTTALTGLQTFVEPTTGDTVQNWNGNSVDGCFVWGDQFEAGAMSALQTVTSAADITESGQPDVWHTLWDGTSDFGTFEVQSFGSASLFAAAGQAWTVWGVFRTASTAANQTLLAKAAASPRDLHIFLAATTNVLTANIRDAGATSAYAFTDGAFHVWTLRWDGLAARLWTDKNASESIAVGTSAETAQNILVSARTASSPAAWFNGHNDVAMIDRALTDGEIATLMGNLNTTYRSGL